MSDELPHGWQRARVADLIEGIESGKNLRCEERPPASDEQGIVKISAVTWGSFDPSQAKTVLPGTTLPPEALIRDGDLLMSRANTLELVGATVVVDRTPGNLYLSDKVLRLRTAPEMARWLNLFLRSGGGRREIEARATGNQLSMRNIGQEAIRSIEVPLPPLAEQRRIVARIEALFARTRRARADLERIPRLCDQLTLATRSAAFIGELTESWRASNTAAIWSQNEQAAISDRRDKYLRVRRGSRLNEVPRLMMPGADDALPQTWGRGCLADVSDLRVGYAFKSEWFAVDGPKLVRGANVAPGRLDWSDEKRLDVNRADQFADYQLRNGDIVLAMDRPLISGGLKAARVEPQDEGALLVQRVASPMPTGLVDKTFLWHLFNSQFFIDQIGKHATGSDLPHISSNDILTTPAPLPPLAEQKEISTQLDRILGCVPKVKAESNRALALLDHLERSILASAFRGDLVPQDPADEPAAALLSRLAALPARSPRKAPRPRRGRGMTPAAIQAIADAVPGAIARIDPDPSWPDDLLRVAEDDPLFGELEDELFPTDDPDDGDPLGRRPRDKLPQDEEIEVFGTLLDLEPRRGRADPRDQADAVVADIAGRLRDRFGQGWPGAPGGTDLQPGATAGGAGVQNQMPNPDAYAFYQSWHRDLPRDTTHSIIRGAGIPMPLGQLTAASDAELRTAGRVA